MKTGADIITEISNKRHTIPFIECFILSFLLLVETAFETLKGEYTLAILYMIGVIFNFILYSVLKKKYNFEINAFLYGVGFASCCVMLVWSTMAMATLAKFSSVENLWPFYILPFTSLYYSYATLLQNKEKKINRTILCLTAITFVSFAVLMIFEMIESRVPYMSIFPAVFGLYFAYCLIRKKGILNLREFTWSPFLPIWFYFILFMFALLMTGAF